MPSRTFEVRKGDVVEVHVNLFSRQIEAKLWVPIESVKRREIPK